MSSRLWLLLFILPILRLLKARPLPSREKVLPPIQERVVLLGASSGVGRDLAHAYAKRGARICLVARRADSLEAVRKECLALGSSDDKLILVTATVTSTSDLIKVRDAVVQAWGGLDTLHIIAGVPSTTTLLDLAGVPLTSTTSRRRQFQVDGKTYADLIGEDKPSPGMPSQEGMDRVAEHARACGEINYVGTVLALACFLPLLATTSTSPALHHLSSVAASNPAPCRTIYSATKAAAMMAVESCRVECEGCGVRLFSLLPGTIANDFRKKTAFAQIGGVDETLTDNVYSQYLVLAPDEVVKAILYHLSLNPSPQPLIPYPPFSWMPSLSVPPKHRVHLPWQFRLSAFLSDTPLGWMFVEKRARMKYGLPP